MIIQDKTGLSTDIMVQEDKFEKYEFIFQKEQGGF